MIDRLYLLFKRIFTLLGFISLMAILILFANFLGMINIPLVNAGDSNDTPPSSQTVERSSKAEPDDLLVQTESESVDDVEQVAATVAIISGHAGNDSGAVCENSNGDVVLTEADVVAKISKIAADELRNDDVQVVVLDEFDSRLDGLQVDVLVSLHSDSCLDRSGFKAVYYEKSTIPVTNDRLLACINARYAAATGLAEHPNTITEDMTDYHAFRKIDEDTPAVIVELGFLGGDIELLTQTPERAAAGIVDSIQCFLEQPESD